jgi:poly-gamma-glutamate capsule biosynthesis protein CapA/YwtB (metallophosphatase superfamily)
MTATAVRPTGLIPSPRAASDDAAAAPRPVAAGSGAVAYQRVLHQLVRRELRLLADLAAWAPAEAEDRTSALARHSELIGRVLLHHHAVERTSVWPALLRAVPAARPAVAAWTARCARIDHMLRDAATAARQWQVAGTEPARDAFAAAARTVADAVEAQLADEERTLLPLVGAHLAAVDWATIAAASHCRLSGPEQLFVLGLALEDSCAEDRARLLEGLPWSVRTAWRVHGARRYRAAVVRLRGAPPAA